MAVVAVVAGVSTSVEAQPAVCRQLESELASLGSGGGNASQYARQAAATRSSLAQINREMSAIGCFTGGFLFGPQPPPQCGNLRATAASLQSKVAQLEGASRQASGGNPQRRAQIMATLDAYNCRGGARGAIAATQAAPALAAPARERNFFERLFGTNEPESPRYSTETLPAPDAPQEAKKEQPKKPSFGGPMAVCVRTCDGYFFPVNYEGVGASDNHEEVCQASCPNAATEVYYMPAGADLDRAANESGQPYTALPTAFNYRKSYDPACTCKAQGQSWAQALQRADELVGERRRDITVTQESSNRMAQPKPSIGLRGTKAAKPPEDTAALNDNGSEKLKTDFATNSKETAGIGPRRYNGRVVSQTEGDVREQQSKDGEKKLVRVVAPELAPVQ